jgi:hypothetical protein
MSRLQIPIVGRILWATGDVKLRVDLDLDLKDTSGNWHRLAFRVDSGTEITTFSARQISQTSDFDLAIAKRRRLCYHW